MDSRRRVAVVTGASGGIGSALTREFLDLGYSVARCDRKPAPGHHGVRSRFYSVDVRDRARVEAVIREVADRWGRVDVLVNNAGVRTLMPIPAFDEERFSEMWETNFMGTLHMTLAALPFLRETKGRIINMASVSGFANTLSGSTFYAISKAAIMILTRRLAFEVGDYGIRVNAIAPGVVKSNMSMQGKTGKEAAELEEFYRSRTMLHTVGRPRDVAKIAAFLASDSADYITGQVIVADGGNYDYLGHGV